ncbi:MAG: OmpA family protein [Acidobacteria bacterium]|nr:OmpA family protein [Acidobacteriota bacterium]
MRTHPVSFGVVSVILMTLVGGLAPARADVRRFRAFVYPDRFDPARSLVVEDFHVNETVWDEGGVQYVRVVGPDGTFKLPFNVLGQIEVVRFIGLVDGMVARYEVRVTTRSEEVRIGALELRVMRGMVSGNPWHLFPGTREDRGANFWRIVIGDVPIEPTVAVALPPPAEAVAAPAPELPPPGIPGVMVVPPPPAVPPSPPELPPSGGRGGMRGMELTDEEFARMSLDELNRLQPLDDVFFDLDRSSIRLDGADALQRDRDWLRRFGSTRILIQGHTDPRGTHEHNVGLGRRRADAVRNYLVKLGVPANRITIRTLNSDAPFCTEQTEPCWQENRRAHFVITAK